MSMKQLYSQSMCGCLSSFSAPGRDYTWAIAVAEVGCGFPFSSILNSRTLGVATTHTPKKWWPCAAPNRHGELDSHYIHVGLTHSW